MIWTFERGSERLGIERLEQESLDLIVNTAGIPRRYSFKELPALEAFHRDMESFLLRTGWVLLAYSPERRRGRDRRGFPRMNERRRWWTDSAEMWSACTGENDSRSSRTNRRKP
jgi:hypothetical protein